MFKTRLIKNYVKISKIAGQDLKTQNPPLGQRAASFFFEKLGFSFAGILNHLQTHRLLFLPLAIP